MLLAKILLVVILLYDHELLSHLLHKPLAVGVVGEFEECSAVRALVLFGTPVRDTVVTAQFGAVGTHSRLLHDSVADEAVQQGVVFVRVQIHWIIYYILLSEGQQS